MLLNKILLYLHSVNFLKLDSTKKIGLWTSVAIIISSMVGTGVYTSLGFQAASITSIDSLLVLWIVGGIIALCGAVTYGELAVRLPRSGGEYIFLSKIYHPAVGFLSGWVSSTVGFAAPAAMSAMAFTKYFSMIVGVKDGIWFSLGSFNFTNEYAASSLLLLSTVIIIFSLHLGGKIQQYITLTNVFLMLVIITFGLFSQKADDFNLAVTLENLKPIFSPAFAVSLVYVSFAYSGWNSVTYITSEVKDPGKNVPKALFISTIVVMFLYLGLNYVFLYSTPIDKMSGQLDVGFIAGEYIFGTIGGKIISCIICVALLASINSIMFAGPRVTKSMGEDFPILAKMATTNKMGTPIYAIIFQASMAILLVMTSQYDKIFTYIGFTLSLFTSLTVFGIFIIRYRLKGNEEKVAYTTWGYPFTPIIFLVLELWMVVYVLLDKTVESLWGFATILSGLIVYYLLRKK